MNKIGAKATSGSEPSLRADTKPARLVVVVVGWWKLKARSGALNANQGLVRVNYSLFWSRDDEGLCSSALNRLFVMDRSTAWTGGGVATRLD